MGGTYIEKVCANTTTLNVDVASQRRNRELNGGYTNKSTEEKVCKVVTDYDCLVQQTGAGEEGQSVTDCD